MAIEGPVGFQLLHPEFPPGSILASHQAASEVGLEEILWAPVGGDVDITEGDVGTVVYSNLGLFVTVQDPLQGPVTYPIDRMPTETYLCLAVSVDAALTMRVSMVDEPMHTPFATTPPSLQRSELHASIPLNQGNSQVLLPVVDYLQYARVSRHGDWQGSVAFLITVVGSGTLRLANSGLDVPYLVATHQSAQTGSTTGRIWPPRPREN